jgi:hypothetical protein
MAASLGLIVISRQEFCMGGCDKRTRMRESEESPLIEVVARKRLVKTVID